MASAGPGPADCDDFALRVRDGVLIDDRRFDVIRKDDDRDAGGDGNLGTNHPDSAHGQSLLGRSVVDVGEDIQVAERRLTQKRPGAVTQAAHRDLFSAVYIASLRAHRYNARAAGASR